MRLCRARCVFNVGFALAAVALSSLSAGADGFAPAATDNLPTLFGEGVIPGPANEDCAAFTPDGKPVWLDRSAGQGIMIMASHEVRNAWSTPCRREEVDDARSHP